MPLKNKSLLKEQAYINNQFVSAKDQKTFAVKNPFNGETLAQVADLDKQSIQDCIEIANKAFYRWRKMTVPERCAPLLRLKQLVLDNQNDLATLITLEQGKPLAQAQFEVNMTAVHIDHFCAEAYRIHGITNSVHEHAMRRQTMLTPVGVVAAITPWNFPYNIPLLKCIPAMLAGCSVILKPAQDTPLCMLAFAALCQQADMPAGVFNVITSLDPKEAGDCLTQDTRVRKITFTGSTKIGKQLMQQAAMSAKNVCLEMGGNSPFILFEDANIDVAVEGAFFQKLLNAGQVCTNINRAFIHKNVYDEFIDKISKKMSAAVCGFGLEPSTQMGPLINQQGFDKVTRLVNDAVKDGATIITGGKGSDLCSLIYEPTVLTNVTPDMRLYREEIFGPILPCYVFEEEQEVLDMANDTEYGLAAYYFTEDHRRIWRVNEALEAGTIGINSFNTYNVLSPFGGFKQSGIGREGGIIDSLNAYCENKSLHFGTIS